MIAIAIVLIANITVMVAMIYVNTGDLR